MLVALAVPPAEMVDRPPSRVVAFASPPERTACDASKKTDVPRDPFSVKPSTRVALFETPPFMTISEPFITSELLATPPLWIVWTLPGRTCE